MEPLSPKRYHGVAVAIHWTIALLIAGQIAGGLYMEGLPREVSYKYNLYDLHKSFGLSILALTLFRLGWRFAYRAPSLPASVPAWQRIAARSVHWAFYGLLIATPIAGWAMSSLATDQPIMWFGLFQIPHLPFAEAGDAREALKDQFSELHEYLAFTIIILLGVHIAAAIKHALVDKDGVFDTMVPKGAGPWFGGVAILAVLALGVLAYFLMSVS